MFLRNKKQKKTNNIYKVCTGPGKPGILFNIGALSRRGKSWKKTTGPGKAWKSVKLK